MLGAIVMAWQSGGVKAFVYGIQTRKALQKEHLILFYALNRSF